MSYQDEDNRRARWRKYQDVRQRQTAPLPDVLTLGMVRPALRAETVNTVAQLHGGDPFAAPLDAVLPRLDPQLLALLIRDLEDAPNDQREVPERVLWAIITAIWQHGDQRLGKDLFAALVSEYE